MTLKDTLKKTLETDEEEIAVKNKVQKWAAHNAYTLTFLSFMFVVTWTIMVILHLTGGGG